MTPEIKKRIDQIRRGEVPEGYQKGKKAMFPIDWKCKPLSSFVSMSQGYTFSRDFQGKAEGDWNYFKVADIGLNANAKYLEKAINMVDNTVAKSIRATSFAMGYLLHTYFGYAVNTKNYLFPVVQKGAKNTINITNSGFLSNKLYLPMDQLEQLALAKIFSTADKEIYLLQQDLVQEKQKKKALMQLLLTGIVRVNV